MVQTFNRALMVKETARISLRKKTRILLGRISENIKAYETLLKNLNVYQKSKKQIEQTLQEFLEREEWLKEKYEKLLSGVSPEALGISISSLDSSSEEASGNEPQGIQSSLELSNRRKGYLEQLNVLFSKLETELGRIEELKREMNQARSEIEEKSRNAGEQKSRLEENHHQLMNQVKEIEIKLERSLKEEGLLLKEFDNLVKTVDNNVETKEKMHDILFTHLSKSQSKNSRK